MDVDPPSSPQVAQAQSVALRAWYDDGPNGYDELKRIGQPTLTHGHRDIMLPTMNTFIISQHIPDAQLIIYPKSGGMGCSFSIQPSLCSIPNQEP